MWSLQSGLLIGLGLVIFIFMFDYIVEFFIHRSKPFYKGYIPECTMIKTVKDADVPVIHVKPDEIPSVNKDKYIIYSHGNRGNIQRCYPYVKKMADRLKINVICYDYAGYGFSKSYASEKNCYQSLEAVVDYIYSLQSAKNSHHIYLIGRSLGTGVVINYITKHKWNTPVILLSPYLSIFNVYLNSPYILPFDKFKTGKKLDKVQCPVSIYHGKKDRLIKYNHSVQLHKSLNNYGCQVRLTLFEDADHFNILDYVDIDDYTQHFNL